MILRIDNGSTMNACFYEGSHIKFSLEPIIDEDDEIRSSEFVIQIEGLRDQDSFAIRLDCDGKTRVFLMNEQGKTIDVKRI